jgi:hypothetical protein
VLKFEDNAKGSYVPLAYWKKIQMEKNMLATHAAKTLTRDNHTLPVREIIDLLAGYDATNFEMKKASLKLRWNAFWRPLSYRRAVALSTKHALGMAVAQYADNDYLEKCDMAAKEHKAAPVPVAAVGDPRPNPISYMHGEAVSASTSGLTMGPITPILQHEWETQSWELTDAGKAVIAVEKLKLNPLRTNDVVRVKPVAKFEIKIPHRKLRVDETFVDGKIVRLGDQKRHAAERKIAKKVKRFSNKTW